ncbi:MAG: MazG family protein [Dermatophilaceae bacterium]
MPRLTLLATTPRVAPGLLSRDAWQVLESATTRLAASSEHPLPLACVEAGLDVEVVDEAVGPAALARQLVQRATVQDVVWLGSDDGDPGLSDAVAAEVSSRTDPPDVEILLGSWDVAGARLLDVVAAMDRLRSSDGCPWDAEQTHESLAAYLVEEAYETLDAIVSGDTHHLAEELGDVLLQVVFHARVAAESADGFDIDDVAGLLVDKLVRRHPHVFADGDAESPEQVEAAWERIKADERGGGSGDTDLLHGVPAHLPVALAADKVAARVRRRGLVADAEAEAEMERALADLTAAEEHARETLRVVALSARRTDHPDDDHG